MLINDKNGLCGYLMYSNANRQIIIAGISYGMMIFHRNKIIHLDLMPEYILLNNNYYPVITNFGFSLLYEPLLSSVQSRCTCSTPVHMTIEVISDYD